MKRRTSSSDANSTICNLGSMPSLWHSSAKSASSSTTSSAPRFQTKIGLLATSGVPVVSQASSTAERGGSQLRTTGSITSFVRPGVTGAADGSWSCSCTSASLGSAEIESTGRIGTCAVSCGGPARLAVVPVMATTLDDDTGTHSLSLHRQATSSMRNGSLIAWYSG